MIGISQPALLGLELAKASDTKSQRRLLGWWTELLGKGGQNMLGHGEDHLVVVAQKHQKDCANSMNKDVVRLGEQV